MGLDNYYNLIDSIAHDLVIKMREEYEDSTSESTNPVETFQEWATAVDTDFFDAVQEVLSEHISVYIKRFGWQTNDMKYIQLNHAGAVFIMKNSDNLYLSIDGAYRKDDYLDVASACIEGDVYLHIAKMFGVDIAPEDCTYFNRSC